MKKFIALFDAVITTFLGVNGITIGNDIFVKEHANPWRYSGLFFVVVGVLFLIAYGTRLHRYHK